MWWDEETIETTVQRSFVLSQLQDDEKTRIDDPVNFGGGLTESTYLEWIEQRARKLFLILTDLGVPDQIFGVIDDSWGDEDLPIPIEAIDNLRLTPQRDEALEQRFWEIQFTYLLRPLSKGTHLEYAKEEAVPLDVVEKRAAVGHTSTSFDKVSLPGHTENVFLRKRIILGNGPGETSHEEFLTSLDRMKTTQHKHVVSLWASYVHHHIGYLVLTPVEDGTIRTLIAAFPSNIKAMPKQERRTLFLIWLHCLADALAHLHSRGISHGTLRPSSVGLSLDNKIVISPNGSYQDRDIPRGFDKETYDFSAPEQLDRSAGSVTRVLTARVPNATGSLRSGSFSSVQPSFNDASSIYTNSTTSNHSFTSNSSRGDTPASDVFSLGCIFLEILTQLLKRTSKNFASHRSAKNKTPGRGGGLPDSSYHKNLGQVESWMATLAKDASKKEKDDKLFRGIKPILEVVTLMISTDLHMRPTALSVRTKIGKILTEISGIQELCCCDTPQWDVPCISPASPSEMSSGDSRVISPTSPQSTGHHVRTRSNSSSGSINTISTVNTLDTIRASDYPASMLSRQSTAISTLTLTRSITGDGREIKQRRYASGGGRTAKPRPKAAKQKQWQTPLYSGKYHE